MLCITAAQGPPVEAVAMKVISPEEGGSPVAVQVPGPVGVMVNPDVLAQLTLPTAVAVSVNVTGVLLLQMGPAGDAAIERDGLQYIFKMPVGV
jgi:hypothetical protein